MTTSQKLHVFFSYSSLDKWVVRELYKDVVREAWVQPWLDSESIVPGQDWQLEIRKAIRKSDVIIVFISKQSFNSGYVNKEIKMALEEAASRPKGEIFIIPVRLEESEIPRSLAGLQYLDYSKEEGSRRLLEALRRRASALGIDDGKQMNAENAIPFPRPTPRPMSSHSLSMMALLAITIMVSVFILSLFAGLIEKISSIPWFLSTTSWTSTPDPTFTFTPQQTRTFVPDISKTPNPTQLIQTAFSEIDGQFDRVLKGNIAFNRPEKMIKDEAASIQLILSPALSESILATQIVERGNFVTSTAEPNVLIAPNGEMVTVETNQIEITQRMKAVLLPQDPDAFTVAAMHDDAEQVVSAVETTVWRWSVAAKKEGQQTLELIIYQLVKYDGKEFWHEVETYKADIVVEVSLGQKIKSLDWYWIAGFIVTLIGAILGIWKWLDERKKKPGVMKIEIVNEDEKGKPKNPKGKTGK